MYQKVQSLVPILFNIFVNDLFFFITKSEACNFADDNTLYSCNNNLGHVFSNLKYDLRNVLDWFKINSMLLGVKNIVHLTINVNSKIIPCSNEVKLLGITIDNELKFKKHIEDLCKKASYKLHALRRIRGYLKVEKARILANTFIDSHFNYALLIWMFAGKTLINKICKIHHIGWFTMNITNHTENFFNSAITCLFIKDTCNIWLWKFLNPLCI